MLERFKGASIQHLHPDLRDWDWSMGAGPYLYGSVGTGKTYASIAMLEARRQQRGLAQSRTLFVNAASLFAKKRAAMNGTPFTDPEWHKLDIVVLDDIDKLRISGWVAEELFILLNTMWARNADILITSNESPAMLRNRLYAGGGQYAEAIMSRLKDMARSYQLEGGDRRGNMANRGNRQSSPTHRTETSGREGIQESQSSPQLDGAQSGIRLAQTGMEHHSGTSVEQAESSQAAPHLPLVIA